MQTYTALQAIESFMVLFRMTGNPQYREWGWEIFQVRPARVISPSITSRYCSDREALQHPLALL
jgi:hypothetical protein